MKKTDFMVVFREYIENLEFTTVSSLNEYYITRTLKHLIVEWNSYLKNELISTH